MSEGLERTTGSTVVTKAAEPFSDKNAEEIMEKAAEDGVNVVLRMVDQEGDKGGENEVSKEVEQEVNKEDLEVTKQNEQEVSKETVDPIPEPDLSPDVTLNQLKVEQKRKRAAAASTDQGTQMMQTRDLFVCILNTEY